MSNDDVKTDTTLFLEICDMYLNEIHKKIWLVRCEKVIEYEKVKGFIKVINVKDGVKDGKNKECDDIEDVIEMERKNLKKWIITVKLLKKIIDSLAN